MSTSRRRTMAGVSSVALGLTLLVAPGAAANGVAPATTPPMLVTAKKAKACPIAPKPFKGKKKKKKAKNTATRFGISLSTSRQSFTEAVTRADQKFGRVRAVRIFDSKMPSADAWKRRAPVLGTRMVVTSFRMPPQDVLAGRYDAQLRHFFATAPRTGRIMWNYYHEPEPEIAARRFTAAQYREAFRRIARISGSVCHPNLYPTLILTGWTANPASGRNWKAYYPGHRYVSVLAWDPYNSANHTPTSYQEPAKIFAPVIAISQKAGKPWGIAETGSALVPGDDGRARAAWLTAVGRYLKRRGAAFALYFDSTHHGDFLLRDRPSINAWSTWVRRPH